VLHALRYPNDECIVHSDPMDVVPFSFVSDPSSHKMLRGAVAGFMGTAPMSSSMLIGWRLLLERERYHLPPRLVTEKIVQRLGLKNRIREQGLLGLSIFSHFAYGAVFRALYALFEHRIPLHSRLKGAIAGLALWTGSYLGWLPAMGILTPATRHPWRRNLLMIIAHVIWGVTLGETLRKIDAEK
jgi:uncharacterized membrane protein YagU involved in acid resistance